MNIYPVSNALSQAVYGVSNVSQKKGDPKIVGVVVIPSGEVSTEGFQNVTVWVKATGLDPDTEYGVTIGTHLFSAKDSLYHGDWNDPNEYVSLLKKSTARYNIVTFKGSQLMAGVILNGEFMPEVKNDNGDCYDGYITIGKSFEYNDEMGGKAVVSGGYKMP